METEVNAIVRGAGQLAIHFRGHLARRGPTIALIVPAPVVERGGLSLPEVRFDPVPHVFVLARIAGDAAALIDAPHAITETNCIRNHDSSCRRAAQVADDDRTDIGIGTGVKVIFTEKDPAIANHVMRDADLGFSTRVPNAIKLIAPIRAMPGPAID